METISLVKGLGALGLVLGLIAVAALVARHFGLGGGGGWRRRDDKRLGIVETLTLDARRRVLLVRHDNSEHLILLGSHSEIILPPRSDLPPQKPLSAPQPQQPPAMESHSPGPPHYRPPLQPRSPYWRDEPTLGPLPPRGR